MRSIFRTILLASLCLTGPLHAARERPGGDDPVVANVEAVMKEGDLARAQTILNVAIRENPKALYYAIRGGIRGELGELREAIDDLSKAVELDPKLAIAWRDRGTARVLLGELDRALTDFDAAVRLSADEPKAWAARASLQLQRGAWDRAISDATAALHLDPQMVSALYDRASARTQRGELREGLADLEALLAIDSRHARALTARAQIYRRLGELDRALKDADRSVLIDANSADAYTERAAVRGAQGDLTRAIADCSTALLIDGDHRAALMVRALLYLQNNDFAAARGDFETALQQPGMDPAVARHNLAWLLATCPDRAVRDAPRAIALAREAIEKFGDTSPHAFDALAAASAETGDFPAAVENAERALQATDARTPLELGARRDRLALYRQKQTYRLPSPAAPLPPAAPSTARAAAVLRDGEYGRARDVLEEALHHGLSLPSQALTTLAWLLATCPDAAIRDGARAVELAKKAIAQGPASAESYDALAAGGAEAGDFPAALEAAVKAIDATPASDAATLAQRRERLECYRDAKPWRLPAAPTPRAAAP